MSQGAAASGWIDAIAQRVRLQPGAVEHVLNRYDFHLPGAAARPHTLRIVQLHFAGVKPAGPARPTPEPFTFTWQLTPGINAIATFGANEAGKSTVLEVIRWGLRGRCSLQDDVRTWIRQVLLEIDIDSERIVVVFSVLQGRPDGYLLRRQSGASLPDLDGAALAAMEASLTGRGAAAPAVAAAFSLLDKGDATLLGEFHGQEDFERAASGLMLDRLGFERLTGWQALPRDLASQEDEGVPARLDWTTWSNVLVVSGLRVLLGNEVEHSARLLQVYLGTSWAGTAVDLKTVVRRVEQQAAAARRRDDADLTARQAELTGLARDVAALEAEYRQLGASGPSVGSLEDLLEAVERAVHEQARAAVRLMQAKDRLATLDAALLGAQADLLAVTEASVSRRFFHSLTPTCCPRCDTSLTVDRFDREAEGECSLCAAPIELVGSPPPANQREAPSAPFTVNGVAQDDPSATEESVELAQDIEALTGQHESASQNYQEAAAQQRDVAGTLERARASLAAAGSVSGPARRRRAIELELAGKQALLEDYKRRAATGTSSPSTGADADADADLVILKAALKEAEKRRDREQSGLLSQVSARIYELGRSFGLDELESVELNGAVQLWLRKGGEGTSYSKLTGGEKLRLKVATTVALLQVGRQTGVGRHPGLLIIDSVGAEEMGDIDLISMLRSLWGLAEEGPQVLLASARAATLSDVLPEQSMRVAPHGERLW